jgi:tetratricopeptide (TPR) repeat protein
MSFHALGAIQEKLGKMDTALENLLQAVTLNPDNRDAWVGLGNVYRKLELVGKAIPAYKRALSLDPEYVQARLNLAAAYRQENEAEAFKKEIAALARLVKDESPLIQAGYYSLSDQPDRALELLDTAIQGNRALIEDIREDPCFEGLKDQERYHELLNLY